MKISQKHHKHFLIHTFEHLFGVFFVFCVAMIAGYVASAQTSTTPPAGTTGGTTDTTPPTPPSLHLQSVSSSGITFNWDGSTDNVGVVGYKFYKNGNLVQSLVNRTYTDSSNLTPGTVNAYYVKAIDAAGNESAPSDTTTVTIPSQSSAQATSQATSQTTATGGGDTIPPTPPTIAFNGIVGSQMNFTFSGATDNVGVVGYELYKNDVLVSTFSPTQTSYSDLQLVSGVTYHYYARAIDAAKNRSQPSNVLNITSPTSTPSPETPPSGTTPVSFTVTPAPVTDCSSGKPMTEVFFALSNTSGGKFQLSHDGGLTSTTLAWGKYTLPNDTYTWKAVVNTGYTVEGQSSDVFTLNRECKGTTATTPTSTTSSGGATPPPAGSPGVTPPAKTTTTPPPSSQTTQTPTETISQAPSQTKPSVRLFVENVPVTKQSPVFNTENVELRVMVSKAKKVNFYAIVPGSTAPLALGVGVIDDLLSTESVGAWTYVWDTSAAKESSYKLFARILRLDGTQLETAQVPVSVDHQAPSSAVTTGGSIGEEERTLILARVTDPTLCTTDRECKVYCESHPDELKRCLQYARSSEGSDTGGTPSLTDNIPEERITNMLNDKQKRSKDIPDIVKTPEDLKAYCADPAHAEVCTNALVHNDLATLDSLAAKKAELLTARENEEKVLTGRTGARIFIDTDKDGISDYDEINIYHTNPNDPDTDHDGFPDGREIEDHTNPNGALPKPAITVNASGTPIESTSPHGEEVVLENPLLAGVTNKEMMAVANIVPTPGESQNETRLKFSGHSLPNSFVTIYIFSEPIVVTVKTDVSGAWTYTLEKDLPDGSHQVMTAINDAGGRILAKSEPLPFVKEAAAVSVGSDAFAGTQKVPGFFSGPSLYALIAILIGLLGAAFSIIGFIAHRRNHEEMPMS